MAIVKPNASRRRVARLAGELGAGVATVLGLGALRGVAEPPAPWSDVVICGAAPSNQTSSLVLRLRDVHLAEVFQALHELTGEDFIVDGDVGGRASVEVAAPDLAAALSDVARGAALAITREGRVWRVCRADRQRRAAEAPPGVGLPIHLSSPTAELADLVRLFREVGQIEIALPSGDPGQASIFVKEMPWDTCLWYVFDAAGLRIRRDDGRGVVAERDPGYAGLARTLTPRRPSQDAYRAERERFRKAHPRAHPDLPITRVGDVDLAGVGRLAGEWWYFAYVYGELMIGRAGQALDDGAVEVVGQEGVTFILRGGARQRSVVAPVPCVTPTTAPARPPS